MENSLNLVGHFDFVAHLSNSPFGVVNENPKRVGDMVHIFTMGMSRFGRAELCMHHPKIEYCQELLNEFGELHMAERLEAGLQCLKGYKHDDTGEAILFTARYLSGAELYAAAESYNKLHRGIFGQDSEFIYKNGICQIFWPDEDNIPLTLTSQITTDKQAQDIEPVKVH